MWHHVKGKLIPTPACLLLIHAFVIQGSLEVFAGLGLILGPPIGGWFYQSFGYEVPFLLLGCVLLIMVPFNIYVLPSIGSSLNIRNIV